MVGHVAPEAARGGPLAVVRDGDPIAIDVDAGALDLELSDDELGARLAAWTPPPPPYAGGVFARYRRGRLGVRGRGAQRGSATAHGRSAAERQHVHRRAGLGRRVGRRAGALGVALEQVPVDGARGCSRRSARRARPRRARRGCRRGPARSRKYVAPVDRQQRDVDAHAVEAGEDGVVGDRVAAVVDRDAVELEHVADEARRVAALRVAVAAGAARGPPARRAARRRRAARGGRAGARRGTAGPRPWRAAARARPPRRPASAPPRRAATSGSRWSRCSWVTSTRSMLRAEDVDRRWREPPPLVLGEERVDQQPHAARLDQEARLAEPRQHRRQARNLSIASATPSVSGRETGPPTSSVNDAESIDGGERQRLLLGGDRAPPPRAPRARSPR